MNEPRFAEINELNGLGARLNFLEKDCAACQGRTSERLNNGDLRMKSQHEDITKLFDTVDELKAALNKGIGMMIVMNAVLGIAMFIIGKWIH